MISRSKCTIKPDTTDDPGALIFEDTPVNCSREGNTGWPFNVLTNVASSGAHEDPAEIRTVGFPFSITGSNSDGAATGNFDRILTWQWWKVGPTHDYTVTLNNTTLDVTFGADVSYSLQIEALLYRSDGTVSFPVTDSDTGSSGAGKSITLTLSGSTSMSFSASTCGEYVGLGIQVSISQTPDVPGQTYSWQYDLDFDISE